MNECIEVAEVPRWLVRGRTILELKYSNKGTEVGNDRPVAFLQKLVTGLISDKTYHLEENKLLPEEQKGSRRKCQGTKDQLVTDAYCKVAEKERKI